MSDDPKILVSTVWLADHLKDPDLRIFDASWYLTGFLMEKPLGLLRDDLARLGIERDPSVHEPEDHIAMLFEVMRYLISEQSNSIEEQQTFFREFVVSGGVSLCDAILAHDQAVFFSHVAAFAKSFLLIEDDAFEM